MSASEHWLDQYSSRYFSWQLGQNEDGRPCHYRPLGLVERGFDLDGIGYEGRSDVNALMELSIASRCTPEQIQNRIKLAWTVLRFDHVLLQCTAVFRQQWMKPSHESPVRYCVYCPPLDVQEAISKANRSLTFIKDRPGVFDVRDFYHHSQNVARIVDPKKAMAEVFVAPFILDENGRGHLDILIVMGVSLCLPTGIYVYVASC